MVRAVAQGTDGIAAGESGEVTVAGRPQRHRWRIIAAAAMAAVTLSLLLAIVSADSLGLWHDAAVALQRWQTGLHRALADSIRAVRDQGASAAGWLIALSFLYGVVHAAGPGHGKAVIATYMLGDARRMRRGLGLAWASAAAQAVTAIALVTVTVHVAGAALRDAQAVAVHLERVGHLIVIALGAAMVWSVAWRPLIRALAPASAHGRHHHACGPGCGHRHGLPRTLGVQAPSWRRSAAVVLSIGLRPCSGALVVLGFAHVVGIPAAGVPATLAMAAGTAITVSLLAMMAVGGRRMILGSVIAGSPWIGRVEVGLAVVAGLCLILLGGLLLAGSFTPAPLPFR